MLSTVFGSVLVFLFGAATASHIGLIADRLPRKEQFLRGRSHCENCDRLLAWWEEFPFFGWLLCRGKCRSCGCKIPISYMILELTGGLIAIAVFLLLR
jgi:prepilin signal peptidase PulO-like enzyme (type II secretory pathway)